MAMAGSKNFFKFKGYSFVVIAIYNLYLQRSTGAVPRMCKVQIIIYVQENSMLCLFFMNISEWADGFRVKIKDKMIVSRIHGICLKVRHKPFGNMF